MDKDQQKQTVPSPSQASRNRVLPSAQGDDASAVEKEIVGKLPAQLVVGDSAVTSTSSHN